MKSKHIDWILGIKCNHWVWPWPWPWPWIFKIIAIPGCITARASQVLKQPYLRNRRANWQWTKMVSYMTMTVTFWWSNWGVKIYLIITGVTSDVGLPSTRLVSKRGPWWYIHQQAGFSLVHVMAGYLCGTKRLPEPIKTHCHLYP